MFNKVWINPFLNTKIVLFRQKQENCIIFEVVMAKKTHTLNFGLYYAFKQGKIHFPDPKSNLFYISHVSRDIKALPIKC